MTYTFPEFTTDSVLEVVSRMWDLSGSVPLPKFELQCPVCGHNEILCKHWRYFCHNNRQTNHPYRCDVGMKCTLCSHVWQHGLVVPKDMHPGKRQILYWRDVKEELQGKAGN